MRFQDMTQAIRSCRWAPLQVCGLLRAAGLAAVLLAGIAAAWAQAADGGVVQEEDGTITLNLRDADIRAFIASVADITGRNFVVDPRVKANVTVISSAPTGADGLYDIFLSILKVHGFTAIPSGDVVKIVPDAVAKQEGQAPTPAALRRRNDALVTAVWHERYLGFSDPRLDALAGDSPPDLYFVCRPDFAWVQDGTRESEAHRAAMQQSMERRAASSGAEVVVLEGPHDHRLATAEEAIERVAQFEEIV